MHPAPEGLTKDRPCPTFWHAVMTNAEATIRRNMPGSVEAMPAHTRAYWVVRSDWERNGIWDERWGIVPGMYWGFELAAADGEVDGAEGSDEGSGSGELEKSNEKGKGQMGSPFDYLRIGKSRREQKPLPVARKESKESEEGSLWEGSDHSVHSSDSSRKHSPEITASRQGSRPRSSAKHSSGGSSGSSDSNTSSGFVVEEQDDGERDYVPASPALKKRPVDKVDEDSDAVPVVTKKGKKTAVVVVEKKKEVVSDDSDDIPLMVKRGKKRVVEKKEEEDFVFEDGLEKLGEEEHDEGEEVGIGVTNSGRMFKKRRMAVAVAVEAEVEVEKPAAKLVKIRKPRAQKGTVEPTRRSQRLAGKMMKAVCLS